MSCDAMKRLLPGLAMDELDVEQKRDIERHLEGCAECRTERDLLARTRAALASATDVETSVARRDQVVGAMVAARDGVLEQAMLRPRSRGLGWAAAAAAVLLAVAGWLVWSPYLGGPSYRVASSGRGAIIRPDGLTPIGPDQVLRRGDRVIAEDAAKLESVDATLELAAGSTLSIQPGQLLLERGAMRVEVRRGQVTVVDVSSDRLVLRAGAFDVSVFTAKGIVSDTSHGEVQTESATRLRAGVGSGSARLEGPNGQVELNAGEHGELDPKGYPTRRKD
jgi:hypothetical protein